MNTLTQAHTPDAVRRTAAAVRQALGSLSPGAWLHARIEAVRAPTWPAGDVTVTPHQEVVCRLADIPDGGVIGIDLPHPLGMPLILRRDGDQVHAWLNVCPQDGHRMDWAPGLFYMEDAVLRCANRSARFDLERDGVCVGGPCRGKFLIAVPAHVDGAFVALDEGHAATDF